EGSGGPGKARSTAAERYSLVGGVGSTASTGRGREFYTEECPCGRLPVRGGLPSRWFLHPVDTAWERGSPERRLAYRPATRWPHRDRGWNHSRLNKRHGTQ